MLTPSLRVFFNYLKSFGRYFGNDCLTLFGFITIYLNYDTDRNLIRQAILKFSKKSREQINIDCLEFIKSKKEVVKIPDDISYCVTVVDGKQEEYRLSAEKYIKDLIWDSLLKVDLTNIMICGDYFTKVDSLCHCLWISI